MDILEEKLKQVLIKERQRFYDPDIKQQKLEEIRQLFELQAETQKRIEQLKEELNEIELMEIYSIDGV